MSKNLSEAIQNIMKENSSENIVIFTNHLKINGPVHEFKGKCADCHECLIGLQDVTICKLEDYEGDDYFCFEYDWLNVNVSEIVAFSII